MHDAFKLTARRGAEVTQWPRALAGAGRAPIAAVTGTDRGMVDMSQRGAIAVECHS